MNIWSKKKCGCKHGNKAHYGKPVQLFKDSDKDGVANVFDCKPHNRRKQDEEDGGLFVQKQKDLEEEAWKILRGKRRREEED